MSSAALSNPLSLFDLSGQSIVITGASGAMGRAIAIALAALDANLLLVSGSHAPLEEVAEEARANGGVVETLVLRPDTLADAETLIAKGVELFGRVDSVLVASGFNKPAAIEVMSVEDWEEIMDANVRGPWLIAKAYGDHVAQRGGPGRMVLVSSVRGRQRVLHVQGCRRFTHQDPGHRMGPARHQRQRDRPVGVSLESD
jgi:NAD(P)-dependent dehydrogenase (short-subunit alcohol dehydrogenase family)